MTRRSTRRQFLKQTAASGVGFWTMVNLAPAQEKSPLERLNFAGVGVGGKGSSDIDQAGALGNVVALCDIDEGPLDKKAEKFAQAKKYFDFRKMLDEMGKNIDAVVVSTPDHTHAPAAAMAIKMGKHVYCQKPMTRTVLEARKLRELAAEKKVCTQLGNQGTTENALRTAVEIIRGGGIGPVREAHIWTNRPVWNQSPDVVARPKETPPTPAKIHWDEFLGPAPERPYHPAYHPFAWRGWWDFGTGALGDMACHTANLPYMALNLGFPTSITAECEPVNPETYPAWAKVTYEFPARGDMPPVKVVWYEGRKGGMMRKGGQRILPPEELQAKFLKAGETIKDSGSVCVGDKGMLYSPADYGQSFRLMPEKDFADYKAPAPTLPRNGGGDSGQKKEWVEAIKASKPELALANFNYAGPLNEFILLGNIAMKLQGQKLAWDGPNLKFTNNTDANKHLHYEYRKGWTL